MKAADEGRLDIARILLAKPAKLNAISELEDEAKPSTSTRAKRTCGLLRQLLESLEDDSPI